jgi:hypothetical protein
MNRDPHIDETLEKLTELVHGQQRAIDMCNEIIHMKNRYIELCEIETTLHREENLRLQKVVLWLSICLGLSAIISLCRIFI